MAARPLPKGDTPQVVTIKRDSTWKPSGGVTINPSDTVQFDVEYPDGQNQCMIHFIVSWGNKATEDPPVIIVGSGG